MDWDFPDSKLLSCQPLDNQILDWVRLNYEQTRELLYLHRLILLLERTGGSLDL